MTLSVIIVNYNVKYFLEQCLYSLQKATVDGDVEIIVVDNASTDESLCYLRPKFPAVRFIESSTNSGFARACNMGFQKSSGEAVLFLNPDTIIAEDTLHVCLTFLKTYTDAGAVGVRMIDGSGNFLKESKRSFPAPLTSAFKLAGLAQLFPRSKTFSRYHLGHLSATQNHEVDVLAGAFMLVRRNVLEKTGAFDEAFFMYGEDVDLSYRIQKTTCSATGGSYKNYYLADTAIIHFKGESTKRGSLNYVRMFYSAMSTFVKKWHGGNRAAVFNTAIHMAIWLRAALAALSKLISWIGLPVLDAVLFLLSFRAIKIIWTAYVKPGTVYPENLLLLFFPAFTFMYLTVAYYAGLYDKQYKPANLVRSAVVATVVLLALYALLPEGLRFSRGILLFGALLAFACMSALRRLLTQSGMLQQAAYKTIKPYVMVAGSITEYEETKKLLPRRNGSAPLIGRLSVTATDDEPKLATLAQATKIALALNAQDLVLCAGAASYKELIRFIQTGVQPLRLRFHAAGSGSIVGSDSSTASGEAFSATTHFNLAMPLYRRLKRLTDVIAAIVVLLLFPVHFFIMKKPAQLLLNAAMVLCARKTWIGYAAQTATLPALRPAVLTPDGEPAHGVLKKAGPERVEELSANHAAIDFWYAQNWEPLRDVSILLKNYRQLGN